MKHLEIQLKFLENLLKNIDENKLEELISDLEKAVLSGNKIIATALGKNVPLCEKFIGTLISLGIQSYFLHTNSAIHGDLGVVKAGDVVIMLSKSGETEESIYLYNHLNKRRAKVWLITYNPNSILARKVPNKLILHIEHEGDKWNIVPNNSSIGYLFILQGIAIELIDRLNIDLKTFKENHPGGAIGKILREVFKDENSTF